MLLQSLQQAMRKMARARARFKDRPAFRRTEFFVRLCEVSGERCGEKQAPLRRSPVIARAPPALQVAPTIITIARVIKRCLHPIAESDCAFTFDAFAQSFSKRQRIRVTFSHAVGFLHVGRHQLKSSLSKGPMFS